MRAGVRVERAGPVVTVVLDRPQVRNAVDHATALQLADAFSEFDADGSAAVAVLWGAGGSFCSGADLHALAGGDGNRFAPDGDGPLGPTRMLLSKPVIAAVSGYAVAGGLELALWCDLRVAEPDAVFGVFCRRFGVPLVDGGTVRLPRIVGLGRALDMILTGRPVGAEEALRIGLVDRLVPPGRARAAAEELAATLAGLPQECLRNDRLSVYSGLGLDLDAALRQEFRYGARSVAAGAREGAQRFTRKRDGARGPDDARGPASAGEPPS
ncbi:MAG TPA: crotonase/enoyl-CoA hydratase family protein [Micromonosporaceae bacterium]|nr:crotonase/enoyl-CoA hydratase family protein [Micromonosporaceae bacterium]